jgi:integrase
VTSEDIVRFKNYRLATITPRTGKAISPKTVKDSDLAGLKTIFGWTVANRRMTTNPASGLTIKLGKPRKLRSKGFTDEEARAILKAAWAYQGSRSERAETTAAKRWLPWLQAYTGARVGELAQLRKVDIRQDGPHWVATITPEAGTVKTNERRDVVLHPHLIELGFGRFVAEAKSGHLFLRPAPDGDVLGPHQGLKNRLAEFAREVVPDLRVAPNHAWRHRFKTKGLEAGIGERVLDAIHGHAARTAGDAYGEVTVKAMAEAVGKLPRIDL